MNIKTFLSAAFLCCATFVHAQNRNNIWCFGDSAGIDFNNLSNPLPIVTGFDTRGSCISIADGNGNLLFYANTRATIAGNTAQVWNKNNQLMQNGNLIVGQGWYNELVTIPMPSNDSSYYLFSIAVTTSSVLGCFYSIIDLTQNGGLGSVTQKNIQLQNFANTDCLTAIKHGNGRDWWVIFRKSGVSPGVANNDFYQYLISPSGISPINIQSVGSINSTNNAKITFSKSGDKLVFTNLKGLIELYNYDRCTGIISNPLTIHPQTVTGTFNSLWGCEFSPNENVLYVTKSDQTSYLFQFDLTAPNILATIDTIFVKGNPHECIGGLKIGPDGKIYESGPYVNPAYFPYPYPDSVYNKYNKNLGVINFPDSLGAACDFQPWSFNLGGKRTYWGLPNNPDYDLGPIIGSACDSLRPVVNFATTDTAFCTGSCISFNDSSTKTPSRWQWFFPGAVPDTSSLQNPTNICYNNSGSYDVKLIACNGVGCDTLLWSNYINVYPQPPVALGNDTATCNLPVQLDAGAGNAGYQWSNGDTTQTITANSTNTYTVTVTNANGCSNSDSVLVTINSLPVIALGNDTNTCNIPVQLDAGVGSTGYQWSNGDTTQIIIANITNTYTVTVTDANGCSNADSVLVIINPLPVVTFNAFASDTLCITQGVQTIGNGNPPGGSYSGTGVTGNTFNSTVAGMGWHNITYQFTDSLGCTNTITDSVWVDLCNGITPLSTGEGSGVRCYPNPASNKIYFDISALAPKQNLVLTIYDAQGSLISSLNLKAPLTAYNLKQLTDGIYGYVVTDGSHYFSGKFAITK